jgi:hypothetical protein
MTGYPNKMPEAKSPIESVAGYKAGQNPRAAAFGQGARNLTEIADATARRREHNSALSRRPTGRVAQASDMTPVNNIYHRLINLGEGCEKAADVLLREHHYVPQRAGMACRDLSNHIASALTAEAIKGLGIAPPT